MGYGMRDSRRGMRRVIVGKATVKDGECAVVFSLGGKARVIEGPLRVRMVFASIIFLDRYIASEFEYLVVRHLNGMVEHVPGPVAMFEDPSKHDKIRIEKAVRLTPTEAAVIFSKTRARSPAGSKAAFELTPPCAKGEATAPATTISSEVSVRVERGPAVVVPSAHEWLHAFQWAHGNGGDGGTIHRLPVVRQVLRSKVMATAAGGDEFSAKIEATYDVVDPILAAKASTDPLAELKRVLDNAAKHAARAMPIERAAEGSDGIDDSAGDWTAHARARATEMGLKLRSAAWCMASLPPALALAAESRRTAAARTAEVDAALALEAAAAERRAALAAASHTAEMARLAETSAAEAARIAALRDVGVDVTAVLSASVTAASRLLFNPQPTDDDALRTPAAPHDAPQTISTADHSEY